MCYSWGGKKKSLQPEFHMLKCKDFFKIINQRTTCFLTLDKIASSQVLKKYCKHTCTSSVLNP